MNNLAVVFESADRYADVGRGVVPALQLARRIGDRVWESSFLAGPISSFVIVGRWNEAIELAAEAEEILPDSIHSSNTTPIHLVAIDCGEANAETGRARLESSRWMRDADDPRHGAPTCPRGAGPAGRRKASAALEALDPSLRQDIGITFLEKKLAVVEALEAAFECGDYGRLEELLDMIESLRPGERPPLLDAHARRFRSKLSGDAAGLAAAADRFRKLEMPFWLAVTELEHAELLAEQGREEEAEPLLAERGRSSPGSRRGPGSSAWERSVLNRRRRFPRSRLLRCESRSSEPGSSAHPSAWPRGVPDTTSADGTRTRRRSRPRPTSEPSTRPSPRTRRRLPQSSSWSPCRSRC